MKKRFCALLSAVLCLALLLPASVSAAEEDIPQTLRYGGSEYQFVSEEYTQRLYSQGTGYIMAVKSGDRYYALGEDLGTAALTLKDGVLTADSGVAVIMPERSEYNKNFDRDVPAKIGDKYLTITELNGLALSAEEPFLWHIQDYSYSSPLAVFYGKIGPNDTHVSGCISFQDGAFGTTQWGNMGDDNLYIYQRTCSHANLDEHPENPSSCLSGGNDAYFFCKDCGSYLNAEKEYLNEAGGRFYESSFDRYATGHHYVNGVCANDPSHIAPEYEPVTADTDLFEEGYTYIIAAPDSGDRWKVMDFDPQNPFDHSLGCTAVMGQDGKLRIDNSGDGTRSAAEFRITNAENDEMISSVLLRVPVGTQYGEAEWGMWAPDNGSKICWLRTDSGCVLMDFSWQPGEGGSHHPFSILVRPDGIAEIQMLTYTGLLPQYAYGTANVYQESAGDYQNTACFHWDDYDNSGTVPNVRLFRAKTPEKYTVNTQILASAMRCDILSDAAQDTVLAVCAYDGEGRLISYEAKEITLTAGVTQEQIPVGGAAEYRVFLLDAESYLPLSAKQYVQS